MSVLRSALAEWQQEDLDGTDLVRLADDLAELETVIGLLEGERLRRVEAFHHRRGHRHDGYTSTTAFLAGRCRMSPGRASRMVATALSLSAMPVTRNAARDGDLAVDEVALLVRARDAVPDAFAACEAGLVDAVAGLHPSDARRLVEHWRAAADGPAFLDDHNRLVDARRLHLSRTLDGMWRLDGWLHPEAGETLAAALLDLTPPPTPGDTRSAPQRRADALADLSRSHLDRPASGGHQRPHLTVIVDLATLRDAAPGRCETVDGTVLPPAAAQRIACDCAVTRLVLAPDGRPLDLGRTTRVVTPAQRRALVARDRHCRFPGCRRPHQWCDAHHLRHWLHHGHTDVDQMVLLCRHHHTLAHEGGWRLAGTPAALEVRRPDGTPRHGP
jgi:hypothetical protein